MTTSMSNTTSTTTPTPTTDPGSGYGEPKTEDTPPVESTEPKTDDYGYDDPVEPEVEPKTEEPKVEPKTEDDPKVEPSTGYDKDLTVPKEEPKVEPKSEDDKTAEELLKKEIDAALGDRPDKELISKFATEHKMTKEQVEGYVELMKSEDSRLVKENEQRVAETRLGWQNELRDDSGFGGDQFAENVARVDRLLSDQMPFTKKTLTDSGGMLPPYIMKDLLKLSKALNPKTSLVSGDPSKPVEKESGDFLGDMYE